MAQGVPTFSFSSEHAQFSSLRVINEDRVAPTRVSEPTRTANSSSSRTSLRATRTVRLLLESETHSALPCPAKTPCATSISSSAATSSSPPPAHTLPADLVPPLHRGPSAEALHAPLHRCGAARRVGAGMVGGGRVGRGRRRQSLPCELPASPENSAPQAPKRRRGRVADGQLSFASRAIVSHPRQSYPPSMASRIAGSSSSTGEGRLDQWIAYWAIFAYS
ncbi:hypothetical protein C8R44DRAFT_974114, partial [Mycena epipterygia]